MADHIYNHDHTERITDRIVGGWRLIDCFFSRELKIGVYIPRNDNWQNPTEYALVFKGITPTSEEDWENNAQQYLGEYSSHLIDGLRYVGNFIFEKKDYEITLIGHSKGGGEAAVNAEFWNKKAIVFNPSIPKITYQLSDEGYVTSYVVQDEILNYLLGDLPIGNTIKLKRQHNGWLPGISTTDRINNHSMKSIFSALKQGGYR